MTAEANRILSDSVRTMPVFFTCAFHLTFYHPYCFQKIDGFYCVTPFVPHYSTEITSAHSALHGQTKQFKKCIPFGILNDAIPTVFKSLSLVSSCKPVCSAGVQESSVILLYTDIYNIAATYYSFFLSCKIQKEILHCLLLFTPSLV